MAKKRRYVEIKSAKYVEDYKIAFGFSDGKKTIVDFGYFLMASDHPCDIPFRNLRRFKRFKISYGHSIYWGRHWDMCFSLETVYKGGTIYPTSFKKFKKVCVKYFGRKKFYEMLRKAPRRDGAFL